MTTNRAAANQKLRKKVSNRYDNIEWKDDKPTEGLTRLPFFWKTRMHYRHSYDPLHIYELIVTNEICHKIKIETNTYVEQYLRNNELKTHSRCRKWVPITYLDIKMYICALLHQGIFWKPETSQGSWISFYYFSWVMRKFWKIYSFYWQWKLTRKVFQNCKNKFNIWLFCFLFSKAFYNRLRYICRWITVAMER